MRPVNPDGTEWGLDTTRLARDEIRAGCLADLRRRDEVRSGGKMNAENNWAPYRAEAKGEGEAGGFMYVPDPLCVLVKQTGDEQRNLFFYRWAAFCREPQDEAVVAERLVAQTRTRRIDQMTAEGADLANEIEMGLSKPLVPDAMPVQDTIPEPEPMPVVHPQPKRGRGRPRKKQAVIA